MCAITSDSGKCCEEMKQSAGGVPFKMGVRNALSKRVSFEQSLYLHEAVSPVKIWQKSVLCKESSK